MKKSRLKFIYIVFLFLMLIVSMAFTKYCFGTFDVYTFRWVFSTLAQVFGTLLGLCLVAVFYIADKLTDDEIKLMKLNQEFSKIFEEVKIIKYELEKYHKIDFDQEKKMAATFEQSTKEIKYGTNAFWKLSMVIMILLISVITYSIIILSSSHALIDTNFADYIMLCLGILVPSFVMIILIWFLNSVRGTIDIYKKAIALELGKEGIEEAKEELETAKEKLEKKENN